MPKVGWTCSRCTFEHHAPGTRCVMCNELRTTKKHMIDFVQGKPIPESVKINATTVSRSSSSVVDPATSLRDTTTTIAERRNTKPTANKRKEPSLQLQQPPGSPSLSAHHRPQKKQQTTNSFPHLEHAPHNNNNLVQVQNPYASSTAASTRPQSNSSVASKPNSNNNNVLGTIHNAGAAFNNNANTITASNNNNVQATNPLQPIQKENWNPPRQSIPQKLPPRVPHNNNNNNNNNAQRTYNSNANFQSNLAPVQQREPTTTMLHYVPGPVPLDESVTADWIFPQHDNFKLRDYQVEITKTSLFHNTLVSLPTGLGKTLVAAVVLYNYHRWFPTGKLIFCAPTLPLVRQQAEACFQIVGIPETDTAILTGKVSPQERAQLWKERRVFFCTPQTVQKDFENEASDVPATQVVCLVLDEAHRATGDYPYVKIIELLEKARAKLRIVGLSATPGSTIEAVQKVAIALRAAKIEFRSDEDPSIAAYVHSRETEVIVVDEIDLTKNLGHQLTSLVTPYLTELKKQGFLLSSGAGTLVQWTVLQESHRFRDMNKEGRASAALYPIFEVVRLCAAWKHALRTYGIGNLRTEIQKMIHGSNTGGKSRLLKDEAFQRLWGEVQRETQNSQGNADVDKIRAKNPKLLKLKEILDEHFHRGAAKAKEDDQEVAQKGPSNSTTSTRAIVFSQFRDSVSEIVKMLEASSPLVRAHRFVGQGKGGGKKKGKHKSAQDDKDALGMKQSEQHQVIREFREGKYNVLVCTSIGEEGLDIGQVDLIVNVDCIQSPIRSLQRVGRTGRKRNGRVVCLLTKDELHKYKQAASKQKTLFRSLRNSFKYELVPSAPMLPTDKALPLMIVRQGLVGENNDFRLSQVGGHGGAKQKTKHKKSNEVGSSPRNNKTDDNGGLNSRWELTEVEEHRRGDFLKNVVEMSSTDRDKASIQLHKRFLKARTMSFAAQTPVDLSRYHLGSTLGILRTFQEKHGKRYHPSTIPVVTRQSLRENKSAQLVFPYREKTTDSTLTLRKFVEESGDVVLPDDRAAESRPTIPVEERTDSNPVRGETQKRLDTSGSSSHATGNVQQDGSNDTFRPLPLQQQKSSSIGIPERAPPVNPYKKKISNHDKGPLRENGSDAPSHIAAGENRVAEPPKNSNIDIPQKPANIQAINPYSTNKSRQTGEVRLVNGASAILPRETAPEMMPVPLEEKDPIIDPFRPSVYAANAVSTSLNQQPGETHDSMNSTHKEDPGVNCENDLNEFRLPTQPDSSDDDSSDDEEEQGDVVMSGAKEHDSLEQQSATVCQDMQPVGVPQEQVVNVVIENMPQLQNNGAGDEGDLPEEQNRSFRLPTQNSASSRDSQSLRLPTQESSSDESSNEDPNDDDKSMTAAVKPTSKPPEFRNTSSEEPPSKNPSQTMDQPSSNNPSQTMGPLHEAAPGEQPDGDQSDSDDDLPLIALKQDNLIVAQATSQREPSVGWERPSDTNHVEMGGDSLTQDTEEVVIVKGRSRKKRPNNPFLTQGDMPSTQQSSAKTPGNRRSNELVDTPADLVDTPHEAASKRGVQDGLTDTPSGYVKVDNIDDVVCAVCFSGDFTEDDPIILCDGVDAEANSACNFAVHPSCYNVDADIWRSECHWRCDPCNLRHKIEVTKEIPTYDMRCISCSVCRSEEGPLQQTSPNTWSHLYCVQWSHGNGSIECGHCKMKGAVQCFAPNCKAATHPHCGLVSHSTSKSSSWTLVQVITNDNDCMSVAFCPADKKELQDFLQQLKQPSAGVQEPPKVKVIPPQQSSSATNKLEKGGRLKKIAATKKAGRNPVQEYKPPKGPVTGIGNAHAQKKAASPNSEERRAKKRARLERRQMAKCFFEEEADIESDSGDEGEMREVADVEAEELSSSSFINDGSQLGWSQDDLGRVDPTQRPASSDTPTPQDAQDDILHRRLDAIRSRQQAFATPMLNRRMQRNSLTPANAPESEQGLGKLHFIRSVLEHARNGGDADEIENLYHKLDQEHSQIVDDENAVQFDYDV